jgi:hypothetical protein
MGLNLIENSNQPLLLVYRDQQSILSQSISEDCDKIYYRIIFLNEELEILQKKGIFSQNVFIDQFNGVYHICEEIKAGDFCDLSYFHEYINFLSDNNFYNNIENKEKIYQILFDLELMNTPELTKIFKSREFQDDHLFFNSNKTLDSLGSNEGPGYSE